jgi:hypothetical protein
VHPLIFLMTCGMVERFCSLSLDRSSRTEWLGFPPVASKVPRPNPVWFLLVGVCKRSGLRATATYQPTWVETQDCCDHYTRHAGQSVGGIRLPGGCVPCNKWCPHWALVVCVVKTRWVTLPSHV